VFIGANTMETSKDFVMSVAHIMNETERERK